MQKDYNTFKFTKVFVERIQRPRNKSLNIVARGTQFVFKRE